LQRVTELLCALGCSVTTNSPAQLPTRKAAARAGVRAERAEAVQPLADVHDTPRK
jgi:hypothetical protein